MKIRINTAAFAQNGHIDVYSGPVPKDADAGLSGDNVLLAEWVLASAGFLAATNDTPSPVAVGQTGVAQESVPVLAAGTATFFRITDAAGNALYQGDVGLAGSGAALVMPDTGLVAGESASFDSFTVTFVAGAGDGTVKASAARKAAVAASASASGVIVDAVAVYSDSGSRMAVWNCAYAVSGNVITLTPSDGQKQAEAAGVPTTLVAGRRAQLPATVPAATSQYVFLFATAGAAGSGADVEFASTAASANVGDNLILNPVTITVV